MANQPPNRTWFRLPNIARQQPPPPPPPQAQPQPPSPPRQPRIPVTRTAFRPMFSQAQSAPPSPPTPQPSAPQTQAPIVAPPSPSPSPTPTPPPPSPDSTTPPPPFAITSPSPPPPRPSPRIVASQPYVSPLPSPTPIRTTRSPPPISLPPTQLNSPKGGSEGPRSLPEAEQEKVLLQETFNKKVVYPSSGGNSLKGHNKSSQHGRLKEADGRKSSSDSEDGKSVRIITMTGENKGALMELGFPPTRNMNGHSADRTTAKDQKGTEMAPPRQPMTGYVNSNVQGINNSILYSCSFTHHDPGVHFALSRKPMNRKGEGNGGRGIHH